MMLKIELFSEMYALFLCYLVQYLYHVESYWVSRGLALWWLILISLSVCVALLYVWPSILRGSESGSYIPFCMLCRMWVYRKLFFFFKNDENYWASQQNVVYTRYTLFLSRLLAIWVYMWVKCYIHVCISSQAIAAQTLRLGRQFGLAEQLPNCGILCKGATELDFDIFGMTVTIMKLPLDR